MNKKFFTLIASMFMLVASLGTTNAQTSTAFTAETVSRFSTTWYYQLRDAATTNVLIMEPVVVGGVTTGYVLKSVAATGANLNQSLWTVTYAPNPTVGGPDFTLINKASGMPLSVASSDAVAPAAATKPTVEVGGDVVTWKWQAVTQTANATTTFPTAILRSYYTTDEIVYLVPATVGGGLSAVKQRADIAAPTGALSLQPVIAGRVYLNANDLNTSIGSVPNPTTFKLGFSRSVTDYPNPFATETLKASDVTLGTYVGSSPVAATDYFVNVQVQGGTNNNKYIVVDTVYAAATNAVTPELPLFGYDSFNATTQAPAARRTAGVYAFQFSLAPSPNTLLIEAAERQDKSAEPAVAAVGSPLNGSRWQIISDGARTLASATVAGQTYTAAGVTNVLTTDRLGETIDLNGAATATTNQFGSKRNYTYVRLANSWIATLTDDVERNVIITLGGAVEGLWPATIADGVYLIQYNASNGNWQNFGADRYNMGDYTNYYFVDNSPSQHPSIQEILNKNDANKAWKQMPFAQWVIENTINNTTRVKISNRETGRGLRNSGLTNAVQYYQVTKGDNSKVYSFAGDTLSLINITADVQGNKTMGYQPALSDFDYQDYSLKYLPTLVDNRYVIVDGNTLKLGAGGVDDKTYFKLDSVHRMHQYGYKAPRIAPILERVAYRLILSDPDKTSSNKLYVGLNSNGIYNAVSDSAHASIFFLKEFNNIDGSSYYALIDMKYYVAANGTSIFNQNPLEFYNGDIRNVANNDTALIYHYKKVGVDDNSLELKYENVDKENRTSTFLLEKRPDPVYRRLDSAERENNAGGDAPDTLKVFRVANPNEILYEDANSYYSAKPGTGPNEPDGSSTRKSQINFLGINNIYEYPDVNRAMYVDTAYVRNETIMPQYMFVMGAQVVGPGTFCPIHGWNVHCGHEKPTKGFVMGRYLINAADSVARGIKPNDYKYDNYTRLAFVKAIHISDSLYILRGNNLNATEYKDIDFAAIPAADRKFLGDNTHKNCVFSLRLYKSVNEDPSQPFMIESEGTKVGFQGNGWVKLQNNVPVIAKYADFNEAMKQADKFQVVGTTENPVSNEEITTEGEFEVTAIEGAVVIKGAADKKVTISNILGQVISTSVVRDSEATLSAPAGIVVVAVEGEQAVKALVK